MRLATIHTAKWAAALAFFLLSLSTIAQDLPKLVPVTDGNQWGYLDRNEKWAIKPAFSFAEPFVGGVAKVTVKGKTGLIDTNGKFVIPAKHDNLKLPSNGLTVVLNDKQWMLADATGKPLSDKYNYIAYPPASDDAPLIKVYRYSAETGGRYGFIDRKGNEVVPVTLAKTQEYSDGMVAVMADSLWGFMDGSGKLVIDYQYKDVKPYSEGISLARINERARLIDKTGAFVNDKLYRFLPEIPFEFRDGLTVIKQENKFGYINNKGETVVEFLYTQAFPFDKGIARVRMGRDFGYIDTQGKYIVPCKFYQANDFAEDKAVVVTNQEGYKSFGYIDRKGNVVIESKYKYAKSAMRDGHFDFHNNRAIIRYDTGKGIIDEQGNELCEPKWHVILPYVDELAAFKHNSRWGLFGYNGEVALENKYDNIEQSPGRLTLIEKHEKWGLADKAGKLIVPVENESIKWMEGGLMLVQPTATDAAYYVDMSGKAFRMP